MRRISIAIALLFSTLLLVCVSSAQQPATTSHGVGNPVGNPDTVINCVGAQTGRIAIFTQSLPPNITLCNSGIYEASPYGGGSIGILNPGPIAALDVNGNINTSQNYQIFEDNVLSIGSPTDYNLFLGIGAGRVNVTGTGAANLFAGFDAGENNTTGTTNTFLGSVAGRFNTTGVDNVFSGATAGYANTTGSGNTFVGANAGEGNTTGQNNLFLGAESGTLGNTAGNNNIYIGNYGIDTDNSTIRIGQSQSAAYVAGIYGVNVGGVPVQINSNGQVGAQTSSLRFKEQVRDMGDSTDALMKLRPVTFLYKPEYANSERSLQYGLIAEEVAKVYPELVAYDKDGQPYSVRYQYLAPMLLNEVQKQAEVIHSQQQEIETLKLQLQVQNGSLQERLSRLERSARTQSVAQK